jgi:hypothetical protein
VCCTRARWPAPGVVSCEPWGYQLPFSPCGGGESGAGAHKLAVVPFDACQQAGVPMADDAGLAHPRR